MQESPTGKHVLLVTIGRVSSLDLRKMNENRVIFILCQLHRAACVCSLPLENIVLFVIVIECLQYFDTVCWQGCCSSSL